MLAYILENGDIQTTRSAADVRAALAEGKIFWLELEERTDETSELLADTFQIHPLVIEDIWGDRSQPKIEDFDSYLYVIVHGVKHSSTVEDIELVELDLVLGKTWVITYQHGSRSVEACKAELERSPRLLRRGPVWIAHTLLDHLVDHYLPIIDAFDEDIVSIEDSILKVQRGDEGQALLARMFSLKRSLLRLRRVSMHQRDILLRLSRAEFDEIPPEAMPFFRDVYDHFARFTDLTENYRDLLTSVLEVYLSMQSNRMNEVMKALTLMSTIMLPLTFIAGVYGMNFEHMPELRWPHGYGFALALMGLVAVTIVAFFHKKRWL